MKQLFEILKATLFFLLIPVCFCNANETNSATIALVMKSLSNPFFNQMEHGANVYAQENDIALEVFGIKNSTDVEHQISILENLISRKYGAIVIAPADSKKLIPVCQKAMGNGIVVINIDNPLDRNVMNRKNIKIPFVGSDNRVGSVMVGEYLKKQLNQKGNVFLIEGIRGAKNAELRKKGFSEALIKDSQIKIIASEPADWNKDKAFSLTMELLTKFSNVDGIFCANDEMALGTIQAIDLLNRKNILVAGYDNLEAARNAIRNNKMHATIEQHPERMGEYGVMMAWKKLNGGVIPDHQSTPLDLITHEHFNKKIGFSISNINNPFFVSLIQGAKETAQLYGMEMVVKNAANSDSRQLMDIVAFTTQNVDAIIVNPTHADTIVSGVNMAKQKNIPVITVDRKISVAHVVTHIASDNTQGGRMAARIIANKITKKGKIIEIEGIPGTSATYERGFGFNEELKKYPHLTISARKVGHFDRNKAAQVMTDLITQGTQFDAVFAHNDNMILGVMDVLEPHSLLSSKILVGFDAIKEAVKAVKEKKITATIAQQPRLMGRLSIKAAACFFRGGDINPQIPVELSQITNSIE